MKRASVIVAVLGVLAAASGARGQEAPDASAASAAPKDRAQAVLEQCFACHGPGGVSDTPAQPTIAGQKADYVARQLLAFKRAADAQSRDGDADADNDAAGKDKVAMRANPVMGHMVENLDGAVIPFVAKAVSQLSCDGGGAAAQSQPTPPRAAGRCASCHGLDGIGRQANVPNVAGQQRAYLRRQLLLIRETAYGAAPRENESWRDHPIMEREAARISIEDVDALSKYYAALDCRGADKR